MPKFVPLVATKNTYRPPCTPFVRKEQLSGDSHCIIGIHDIPEAITSQDQEFFRRTLVSKLYPLKFRDIAHQISVEALAVILGIRQKERRIPPSTRLLLGSVILSVMLVLTKSYTQP